MLRSSTLALCRKVLIYRDIDISFSVACLAALPYETMVKELKAAVPSIQSDFSRLQVVSRVGEELSHLWDEESLLLLFQGLQNNAKWWHVLSSLGIKVDLRIFQCTDVHQRESLLQSIIPDLLLKGNMNLDMVTEYCRQFDLEPEFAAVTYIELLLTSPPVSVTDSSWTRNVRSAAARIEERSTLQLLRRVLPRISGVDYEKVRYVCAWIIDLLSAEEDAADANTENDPRHSNRANGDGSSGGAAAGSDDVTGEFTVDVTEFRKYGAKAATATAQNAVEAGSDITMYRRYLDVAGYLSGLRFPASAISAVATAGGVEEVSGSRDAAGAVGGVASIAGVYPERIPLWQLFNDPWSVIDPLLTHTADFAARLSPLCLPLRLQRNEFNARKIMALYKRMTRRFAPVSAVTPASTSAVVAATITSEAYIEGKKAAIAGAEEAIAASISDPLQQICLWRWIYSQERNAGDSTSALAALEAAVGIVRQITDSFAYKNAKSGSFAQTVDKNLSEICYDIRVLKCESTIKEFAAAASAPGASGSGSDACRYYSVALEAALLNAIPDPIQLVRLVMEVALAISWDLHTTGLHSLSSSGTCASQSLMHMPISHSAQQFIMQAADITKRIASHSGLVHAEADSSMPSQLDVLRERLIGKYLSDLDANGSNGGSSKSNCGLDVFSGFGGDRSRSGFDSHHCYAPTISELRRREDVCLSYRISALVLSIDAQQRYELLCLFLISHSLDISYKNSTDCCFYCRGAYLERLDATMRGKMNRPVRRLTARSRFRAAQALTFLRSANEFSTADTHETAASSNEELSLFRRFLFCLSEMQEIRLPCSEESLLNAMALKLDNHRLLRATSISGSSIKSDPSALVRTWLHDEGGHVAAVELARDLLLSTSYFETSVWFQLVNHMVAQRQFRSLFQTLLLLSRSHIFTDICFSMLGKSLVDGFAHQVKDCVDKVQQVHNTKHQPMSDIHCEFIASHLNLSYMQIVEVVSLRSNGSEDDPAGDWLRFLVADAQHTIRTAAEEAEPPQDATNSGGSAGGRSNGCPSTTAAVQRSAALLHVWPQLSYRSSEWEDALPEDALEAVVSLSGLVTAVLPRMAASVRAQSEAALAVLRSGISQMAGAMHSIAPQHTVRESHDTTRWVPLAAKAKLQQSVLRLLSSSPLFEAQLVGPDAVDDATKASQLALLLRDVAMPAQTLHQQLLWQALSVLNKSHTQICAADATNLLLDSITATHGGPAAIDAGDAVAVQAVESLLGLCKMKAMRLFVDSPSSSAGGAGCDTDTLALLMRWIVTR